jgi:cell division protein FtsN
MEINLEELSSSNLSDLSLDELTAYRKALNERMDEILATADAEQNGSLTDEQREWFDNCEVREREVAAELDKQREDEERRARQRARIAQLQTSTGRHAPSCTATDPDDGEAHGD